MPKPLTIELTSEQRRELEYVRDHHEKAYVRERAAAILKISSGKSGREVALDGLLKRRDPDSVYGWFHRFEAEGLNGLLIRPGRGRKPAFSPSAPERGERQPGDSDGSPSRSANDGPQSESMDAGGSESKL